jgi:hypothetical protein
MLKSRKRLAVAMRGFNWRYALALGLGSLLLPACAGAGPGLWSSLLLALLFIVACASDNELEGGAPGVAGATGGADSRAGAAATGAVGGLSSHPVPCCKDGLTAICYCPPNSACNFGFGVLFYADGTCGRPTGCGGTGGAPSNGTGGSCDTGGGGGALTVAGKGGTAGAIGDPFGTAGDGNGGVSGGEGGAGQGGLGEGGSGYIAACCIDNRIESCICEPNTSCNFGLNVTFFDNGTCCEYLEDETSCSVGFAGAGGGGGADGGGAGGGSDG